MMKTIFGKGKGRGLVAGLLAVVMLFSLATPLYAVETTYDIVGTTNVVEVDGFAFEITEYVDEYHRTTRTFERNFIPFGAEYDFDMARAILLALGMEEETIAMLHEDVLHAVATTTLIAYSFSYSISNADGVSRYVSAEEADSYANMQEYYRELYRNNVALNQAGIEAFRVSNPSAFDNGVVRVEQMTARNGSSQDYTLTVAAHWRTLPSRIGNMTGSVGSSSNRTTFLSHIGGEINYSSTVNGVPQNLGIIRLNSSHLRADFRSGYVGAGAVFNLPFPVSAPAHNMFIETRNFRVIHSHTVRFAGPDSFNIMGTASQSVTTFSPSVGLSLGISGPSLSLGLGVGTSRVHFNTGIGHVIH